jgi:hypothetical protein
MFYGLNQWGGEDAGRMSIQLNPFNAGFEFLDSSRKRNGCIE